MPLTVNWGETAASTKPVICNPDHSMYSEIVKYLKTSDTWYRCSDTDQIQCQNRMLASMHWWAMALDLGSVTKRNVDEWLFRIRFAKETGWLPDLQLAVWTADGWAYRDITRADLEDCNWTNHQCFKNHQKAMVLRRESNSLAEALDRKLKREKTDKAQ